MTQSVYLDPAGSSVRDPLDNPEPDTLYYDDDANYFYFSTMTNYYVTVRFTPPSDFQLRSVYLPISCGTVAGTCSVFVHLRQADNRPGQQLSASGIAVPANANGWFDHTLPAPIDFTAGQDFFIVVGQSPGYTANGWYPLLDPQTSVNRSYYTTGSRTGNFTAITVDFHLRAGGEFEAFTDLAAVSCFNGINGGDPSFFFMPGDTVRMKAEIMNVANQNVTSYSVSWAVKDPTGAYVFADEVAAGPLAADMSEFVEASLTFVPNLVGEYFATCVIDVPDDASALNDTTYLRMITGGLPRWFRYDDNGDAEGQVTFQAGTGKGVVFRPSEFPAQVESLRVYVAATGTATVELWANDATGTPTGATPLWTTNFTAVNGWNRLAVTPPVPVYNNSVTASYLFTEPALAFGKDNSAPNAAENVNMGHVGWEAAGGAWEEDLTGNWLLQLYMADAPAPPTISWDPDSLLFGQVHVGDSLIIPLTIYNEGDGADLNVTDMVVSPIGISSAFRFTPTTLSIPAGGSADVTVTFVPQSVRTYNGLFRITNNSENLPTANVVIRAEGVPVSAENPEQGLPTEYVLAQNYPNPFNPTTEIKFALPASANVRLAVFNLLGQEMAVLADGMMNAGVHVRSFDATELPAGVYFYRLEAGSFTDVKKMMLLK